MSEQDKLQVVVEAKINNFEKNINKVKNKLKNVEKQTKNTTKNMNNSFSSLGKIVGLVGIGKLVKGISALTVKTMGLSSGIEQLNRMVVNGKQAFDGWNTTLTDGNKKAQMLGVSTNEAYKTFARFNQMAGSADGANKLMDAFILLQATSGETAEQLEERFRSAFTGSVEAIENVLPNITRNLLNTKAIEAGAKSYESLNDEMRRNIMLEAIVEGTMKQTGGVLTGNQAKILAYRTSLEQLKISFGGLWVNIAQFVIPALTNLSNSLNSVFSSLGNLTGKTSTVQIMDGLNSGASGTASGLANANKQAKALKNNLQGFDEINLLQSEDDSSSLGIPSIATPTDSESNTDTGQVDEATKKLGLLGTAIKTVHDGITNIGNWCSKNKTLLIDIGIVIGSILGTILAFKAGISIFNAVSSAITFLTSPIGLVALAVGAVIAVIILCIKHWDEIKATAIYCWEAICFAWSVASEWFNTKVIQPIALFFANLWNGIKTNASNAWNGIVTIWNVVANWFNVNITQPISNLFKTMWNGIKTYASDTWDGIVLVWKTVCNWFDANLIKPLGNFFSILWNGFKNSASSAWDSVKSIFITVANWFDIWLIQPITKAFKICINGLIGFVEVFVNSFVKGINVVINALNKMSFKVPDWVPNIGGQTWGFNISQIQQLSIPRLATGTNFVPQDMLAYLHEGEAVVPKKYNPAEIGTQNTGFIDTFVGKLAETIVNGFTNSLLELNKYESDKPQNITVVLDSKTLSSELYNPIQNINNRLGTVACAEF